MKFDKLNTIIRDVLEKQGSQFSAPISENTSLRDDLHLDSFALAELTVKIEAEFGVDVFDDGIVYTVGEILKKLPDE